MSTKGELRELIEKCFDGDADVALFYYSDYGVFTALLMEALKGSAADVTGHISIAGIYALIDKALES